MICQEISAVGQANINGTTFNLWCYGGSMLWMVDLDLALSDAESDIVCSTPFLFVHRQELLLFVSV